MGVSGRRERRSDPSRRRCFPGSPGGTVPPRLGAASAVLRQLPADPFPIPRPDAGGAGDGRAAPKDHGTVGRIEGSAVVGETVFLTENLIATAGKQREHHPDIAPTDYARLQRLLDEGELFRDRYSPRAATAFLEEDGRLWRGP